MELTPKVLKKLVRELERTGWQIEETKKGYQCKSPDGLKIVTMHKTCSEYRAGKNVLSELRKGGFEYSGKR